MGERMKKRVRIGIAVIIGFVLSFIFSATVFAENQLTDMMIEVELQEDGSAIVTEQREMNMDDGTELYITLENLQDSELLDFSVAGFEEVVNWDSNASQEEKAGKYGVIETDNGLELVWGIGEYGTNSYEVTYSLSNLVREAEDGQALLWNFDTFSDIPAENLTVEISGFEPFTEDNVRFWGFGFEGDIQLVDGRVVWEAEEEVDKSKDVTVLLQFPLGLFQTQTGVDMTLEEQQEMAMDGSAYNQEATSNLIPILLVSGVVLVGVGAGTTAAIYGLKIRNAKRDAGQMRKGSERVRENKGVIYDTIPYQGDDLAEIAYLLNEIGKGYFEDYFSAYLLKWGTEGSIHIKTTKKETLFGKDEFDTIIEIVDYEKERRLYDTSFTELVARLPLSGEQTYETGLWIMLLSAADKAGFISDDQIKRWAKTHAEDVEEYADYLTEYSKTLLDEKGIITFEEVTVWSTNHEVAKASAEGDRLFDQLIQFDNYLEEVELTGFLDESKGMSVKDYLIWSVLYYRREEISKQFKELMPEPEVYAESGSYAYSYMPYYWYWYGVGGFRDNWSTGLVSGGFHSQNASSGASGTGGSTSFGGGMGAGGGGGGGAR